VESNDDAPRLSPGLRVWATLTQSHYEHTPVVADLEADGWVRVAQHPAWLDLWLLRKPES
jgi:hypothetical protein